MASGLEAVVKQLTDSGIISSGKLENFVPPKAHPKDVDELVKELVKQNHLTKFQAHQIAQGRIKSLILGAYTILDKIGAGGMGQVFKAMHRRMDRVVAIKILPTALTKDAAAVARFEREVRAAAKLEHPNIVTAYDADQAHGVHFLVMQYVEGSDLSVLVKKNGPFSIAQTVNYILQAARGLEFAHSEGVIHRDIKPSNLLLDKRETVKILDMGLARIESGGLAATEAELTGTGAVMGTVDYMAPEQAMNTKRADARADIYSLGCTLYYLACGKSLYDGETVVEKLIAHRENPIPSLRASRSDAPQSLDEILATMLAKSPDERYQSMAEVIAALQTCQTTLSSPGSLAGSRHAILPSPLAGEGPGVRGPNSAGSLHKSSRLSETPSPTVHTKTLQTAPTDSAIKHNRPLVFAAGVLGLIAVTGGLLVAFRPGHEPADDLQVSASGTGNASPAGTPAGPPIAKAPFDALQAKAHQEAWARQLGTEVEITGGVGMKFRLIPPGEFWMGSNSGDANETPMHPVTITRPYYLGTYEVTQEEYEAVTGQSPSKFKGTRLPVEGISVEEARAFCEQLSAKDGHKYRLPTEAEWEFACRSGTTTEWSYGDDPALGDIFSWTNENGDKKTHSVGERKSNPFGLFDMHGNVFEYCSDFTASYTPDAATDPSGPNIGRYRGFRGGSWFFVRYDSRSADRQDQNWPQRGTHVGFRVVWEVGPAAAPTAANAATSAPPASKPPPENATPHELTPYEVLTSPDYAWSTPENLGQVVNSAANENGAFLAADGLSLWFASSRDRQNQNFDLYASLRDSEVAPWQPPSRLNTKLNSVRDEAGPTLSSDGLTLLFYLDDRPPRGGADLFMAVRATTGVHWSQPVSLGPSVNSTNYDYSPELSFDGLSLLFHSGRKEGSVGGADLWMSRRKSAAESFGPPENLGRLVNSPFIEYDPALSSDNRVLIYFSSRPGVPQRTMLWMSTRDNAEAAWSAPIQLDLPASDAAAYGPCLSRDGRTLIFHSSRAGGLGDDDLWQVRRVPKRKN